MATALETYLLGLVNLERAKVGAPALVFDGELMSAADGHSEWMATNRVLSHTGANGSSPFDRAKAAGYEFTSAAENVAMSSDRGAAGFDTADVDVMHTNLMNSAGHRQNILNPNLKEIGLGLDMKNGSGYITELFGTPTAKEAGEGDKGGGAAPAPAPLPVPKPAPAPAAPIKGIVKVGTDASQVIKGTAGNDTIIGKGGSDTLSGGQGADTFVFKALSDAGHRGDTITDFKVGQDKIDVHLIKAELNMYDTAKGLVLEFDTGAGPDVTMVTLLGVHTELADSSFIH